MAEQFMTRRERREAERRAAAAGAVQTESFPQRVPSTSGTSREARVGPASAPMTSRTSPLVPSGSATCASTGSCRPRSTRRTAPRAASRMPSPLGRTMSRATAPVLLRSTRPLRPHPLRRRRRRLRPLLRKNRSPYARTLWPGTPRGMISPPVARPRHARRSAPLRRLPQTRPDSTSTGRTTPRRTARRPPAPVAPRWCIRPHRRASGW